MSTNIYTTGTPKGGHVGHVDHCPERATTQRYITSDPFPTEAEAIAWCKKTLREWWTNPAPVKLGPREVYYTGRAYLEPFDYGTGHGVSRWSPAKWGAVHKLQKQYLRETAQAWKDATAECRPQLDRFDELGPHFAPRWPDSLRDKLREAAARRDKLVANLGEI